MTDLTHMFQDGSFTALVGPSGAGKSTLLAAIAGFRDLDSGSITARSATGPARFSIISQAATLFMERTALTNVALGGVARGLPMREAQALAGDLLERLGLPEVALTPAHKLSGGERQRVMIARAVSARSNVLLADEPTASLDPDSRRLVCEALREATHSGVTTIVATHDPFVAELADEVLAPWAN
ncbi:MULTISPECIES: ATP-binding cassette domain-containing protein [unclassified Salinibacterium]|uniref:ATP-binding cassette domain-containing protein n=1 Tax=unclassified Salinibacterium TaxID=2632331 RepID=UPI0014241570|nr:MULTISPECIES: ATP-binding cassette domain-containing protein [unclassified Salinibacterium]